MNTYTETQTVEYVRGGNINFVGFGVIHVSWYPSAKPGDRLQIVSNSDTNEIVSVSKVS